MTSHPSPDGPRPLDDIGLAAMRDLITEKAAAGGTIAAKNAERLLATLDAARSASHDDDPPDFTSPDSLHRLSGHVGCDNRCEVATVTMVRRKR